MLYDEIFRNECFGEKMTCIKRNIKSECFDYDDDFINACFGKT